MWCKTRITRVTLDIYEFIFYFLSHVKFYVSYEAVRRLDTQSMNNFYSYQMIFIYL